MRKNPNTNPKHRAMYENIDENAANHHLYNMDYRKDWTVHISMR